MVLLRGRIRWYGKITGTKQEIMAFRKGQSGNPDKQFKKGQSGNPKGRPKLPNMKDIIANVLGDEKEGISAAEAILMKMRIEASKGDVKAAQFLFDRAYGKPIVTVDQMITEKKIKIGYGKQG